MQEHGFRRGRHHPVGHGRPVDPADIQAGEVQPAGLGQSAMAGGRAKGGVGHFGKQGQRPCRGIVPVQFRKVRICRATKRAIAGVLPPSARKRATSTRASADRPALA